MKWQRKIKNIRKVRYAILKLIPETILYIFISYFLLRFFSFKKVVFYLGNLQGEVSNFDANNEPLLGNLNRVIVLTARNMPFEAACYVQALTGKMMLKKRNVPSAIHIGMKKDKKGQLKGHAWLRVGNITVTGDRNINSYQLLATFA